MQTNELWLFLKILLPANYLFPNYTYDDQHEHTFSSYVRIRDVVLKTYLGWWTIGRSGERGSGISVRPARHDDDDICISRIWHLKKKTATTQECYEQYWTSPGGNTPQSSSYTATYHPSRKLSKLDDPDMQDCWRSRDELISDVLLWTS